MIKNCVALNLRAVQPSGIISNELLCYRYIVNELNKLGNVLYARPYLFNTQSLSRDNRRLDIVIGGQKQLLLEFFHGLKGIQMNQDLLGSGNSSSQLPLDQPLKDEEGNEKLLGLHKAWKDQVDIYQRHKSYELHGPSDFVKVMPWVFNTTIPNEKDYRDNASVLKDTSEILVLKSHIYSDFEALPFEMRKWYIGLGLKSESDQSCQDRLDILTHGFKGFV